LHEEGEEEKNELSERRFLENLHQQNENEANVIKYIITVSIRTESIFYHYRIYLFKYITSIQSIDVFEVSKLSLTTSSV